MAQSIRLQEGIYEGGCHSILGILPSGTVNNFAEISGDSVGKDAIPTLLMAR